MDQDLQPTPFDARANAYEVWEMYGGNQAIMLEILAQLYAENYQLKFELTGIEP